MIGKKTVKLTQAGIDELRKELQDLVNTKRPLLVERLEHARSQGDLTENSDYSSAKDELEFMDGRIAELEDVLKRVELIENGGKKADIVDVGTRVTLEFNGGKHVYNIVGEWEADPMNKKISPKSPLGSALMGKKKGDEVEVEAPAGKIVYKILSID